MRPTTLDMGINSEDPTFFNQSVVGVQGINITTMACLSAANLRNLKLLAQKSGLLKTILLLFS